jgi:hypothetical protein
MTPFVFIAYCGVLVTGVGFFKASSALEARSVRQGERKQNM